MKHEGLIYNNISPKQASVTCVCVYQFGKHAIQSNLDARWTPMLPGKEKKTNQQKPYLGQPAFRSCLSMYQTVPSENPPKKTQKPTTEQKLVASTLARFTTHPGQQGAVAAASTHRCTTLAGLGVIKVRLLS
jgi:hypothetical protein